MKKAFALLLCMLMLCSVVAGCSTTEPAPSETKAPAAETTEAAEQE